MGHDLPALAIARLRAVWDKEVGPSARRALLALAVATLFVAAHVARVGSPGARLGAASAIGLAVLAMALRPLILWRRRADPRRVVRDTVARVDPDLGAATLRAIGLVERTAVDDRAGSPSLAGLHLSRLLARSSPDRVADRAAKSGRAYSAVGLGLAFVALAAVMFEPFRVVEGLDVLAAQEGEAPLALPWLAEVQVNATPPEYLHQASADVAPFVATAQPRGTTLTVRGRPLHEGRALVLTDGRADVPFVDDGAGGLVARWTLGDTTSLFIAATFGGVRVRQLDEQAVASITDHAPVVKVEGAPRTVKLLDEPSIPIHYEATDDHGLREVDLVLRAGAREERRVLSRPAADATADRGGYLIQAKDPFFKRTYVPVEVTVEARDNDTVAGPKWGKSPAIIVIPPQVGEPEALRFQALIKARDALTDLVARELTDEPFSAPAKDRAKAPAAVKEHLEQEEAALKTASSTVEQALTGSYGGLSVRGRVVAIARGQLRRIAKAQGAEKKTPSAATHKKLVDESEDVLLAFDVGVRTLGVRDTRAVAKRLADVADEAAAGLLAARLGELASVPASAAPPPSGVDARIDASVLVLDGGGKQLLRLGELGVDLGEIVANDLKRVARARGDKDLLHAELAARDLAARLRRPDPSFSGGGGGRGGVESGAPSAKGEAGEASGADQAAAAGEQELEELARDHANEIGNVEDSLEKALSQEELDALREEAKRHAEAIREAVKHLPNAGGDPSSAMGAAGVAKEEAEAMAGALESGRPRDAVDSGKRASQKLEEARRAGDRSGGFFPEERAARDAAGAKPTIDRELAWAQEALEKLRKSASSRAKGDLQQASKNEKKLSERAQNLSKKGDSGDRSLPQEMLDRLQEAEQAMRDAERALQEGDGEAGLRHQRDAQRLLEMARGEREEGDGRDGNREDGKQPFAKKAEIPNKDAHKGPEEFRRRVIEGLGGTSDPLLRDAVKRYAEGLLK